MRLLLDEQLAFKAMVTFLANLHEQLGWDDLPSLLGSMALIDGVPLDAAIEEDWKAVVDQTFADCSPSGAATGLAMDQAYSAVVHFLDARFRKGQTDIGQILQELRSVDLLPGSPELMSEWAQCTALASNSAKAISAVVVKDGVACEIHTKSGRTS
ncbi:hypothetical protein [Dyella silvae]|uniref:hypothetical protein n=1 Tax=Dyella silvae TaxID=2994424 RepID=UPI002263F091|nr:hypothetical protein [Dyella silvae]